MAEKKNKMKPKTDCRHFKGDAPCKYHKSRGIECDNCGYYERAGKRILIIKLGAIGDVIRTTPLVRKLREEYPKSEISWLTHTPEILPKTVDFPLKLNAESYVNLLADKFDILYNLDKDKAACALANLIKADKKKGFKLLKGKCAPIDKDAEHKFLTGVSDNISRKNKLSYVEEIFRIADLPYPKEEYILDKPSTNIKLPSLKKPVIGLNTGAGERWKTRLWPEKNWIELAKILRKRGFSVLLLGGKEEDEKNKRIAKKSNASYFGHFSLPIFIELIAKCDLVVTAVTMAMHLAIALKKKLVVFNNVFNSAEFELYGLGKIIEPEVDCLGCYKNECKIECMGKIKPAEVSDTIEMLLKWKRN